MQSENNPRLINLLLNFTKVHGMIYCIDMFTEYIGKLISN